MLREIGRVRQDSEHGRRRWFQDDEFDLFVWHAPDDGIIAVQLCYDRQHNERAVSWRRGTGFSHHKVDAGEALPEAKMSPILLADGVVPYFRMFSRFVDASAELEPQLRAFLIERLREYRSAIHGTPRKPRRKKLPGDDRR